MSYANVSSVILAAGKGTRMGYDLAKVLHQLAGKSLVQHVLHTCQQLGLGQNVCVVGHQRAAVEAVVEPEGAECVLQDQQLGTGHAVLVSECAVKGDTVLVLCGDAPLVPAALLDELLQAHLAQGNACTGVAARMQDPTGYGRMITDADGQLQRIVEQKDGTPEELAIDLINSGIFAFNRQHLFALLHDIRPENAQGEYYLTDVPKMLVQQGEKVGLVITDDSDAILGINTPAHLAEAEAIFAKR